MAILTDTRTTRLATAAPYCMFALNASLVLVYHVHAQQSSEDHFEQGEQQEHEDEDWVKRLLDSRFHSLSTMDFVLFGCFVMMSMELLDYTAKHMGEWLNYKTIPVRGKHLDNLSTVDLLFIGFSKANTAPFLYFFLKYAYVQSNIIWDPYEMNLWNTLLPLPVLYIVFDFFYTILHWFLHVQAIYPLIHKHHHHQKAPSRANVDAINVNPVEFVLGEYNHLFAFFLTSKFLLPQVHLVCALAFLSLGGLLAGLNHTRYDVVVSIPWVNGKTFVIFDSKAHDVHHRIPQSNYGQYTMFWDHVFGSYRPYNPNDRVNPKSQLDMKTGKTISIPDSKLEKAQ